MRLIRLPGYIVGKDGRVTKNQRRLTVVQRMKQRASKRIRIGRGRRLP